MAFNTQIVPRLHAARIVTSLCRATCRGLPLHLNAPHRFGAFARVLAQGTDVNGKVSFASMCFRKSRWPRTMCIARDRQVALRFLALCERGARRVQPDHEFGEYYTKDNSAEVPLQVFGGVMETPNALSSKDEFVP